MRQSEAKVNRKGKVRYGNQRFALVIYDPCGRPAGAARQKVRKPKQLAGQGACK